MKKIMLVAGEASGDQHAADLAGEIKARDSQIEIFGLGGELMARAGVDIKYNLVSHAVIGIAEVFHKLQDFLQAFKLAINLLRHHRPEVLVLVDFPDMNFRIAAKAKALGIPIIYYISPQVWAWRGGRVKTLKRLIDHMIVIFSFEEPIYQKAGVPVTFVGHPLLDLVKPEIDPALARQRILADSQGPLIALLPGSRSQEIELLLPTMADIGKRIINRFKTAKIFIPLATTVDEKRVRSILEDKKLPATLVTEQRFAYRAAADLAIVSSGTATLETAILGTPMLIGYRMKILSYILARLFVKLPYFGLANLAAGEKIAPEFLQNEFNALKVEKEACKLLTDKASAETQKRGWDRVRQRLGKTGAAGRAAEVVLKKIRAVRN